MSFSSPPRYENLPPVRAWILRTLLSAGWAPILVFAIHEIAELVFNAYKSFPALDIPMHFFGGVAIAYFFRRAALLAADHGLVKPTDLPTHWLLVVGLTGTTTVLWEVIEFLSDQYLGTFSQPSIADCMKDMVLGIAGGVTMLLGTLLARPRHA